MDVNKVPIIKGAAPKLPVFGCQLVLNKNDYEIVFNDKN